MNSSTPKEKTLLELLIKKRGFYQIVFDITLEENIHLRMERPLSELRPLLRQKQNALLSIRSIDKELLLLKVHWLGAEKQADSLSTQIHRELSLLDSLLGDIVKTDNSNQKYAEKHLKELRRKYVQCKEEA